MSLLEALEIRIPDTYGRTITQVSRLVSEVCKGCVRLKSLENLTLDMVDRAA